MYIHFYDNNAALVAKTYQKTIQVGYWASVLDVQEDFSVHHEGAKLKNGHFSRVDFKIGANSHGQTSVVKSFTAILPLGATNVVYKDAIGNVTTSHLRYEKKRAILELEPRYPLYGGWRFTWFHAYTVPYLPALVRTPSTEEYKIKASFLPSVKGLTLEKAALKFILPEGARYF